MPEFPDWTEFCSNETEHRGLDPLGLESVGASIVQNQLPPRQIQFGVKLGF